MIGNIHAPLSIPFMHSTVFVIIHPYRYPRSYAWGHFLVSNFENSPTLFSSNHFNSSMHSSYFYNWCWDLALYVNSFKTLFLNLSLKLLTTCLRQYQCYAWRGLHPTNGFLIVTFIPTWRAELYLWVMWHLNAIRNQEQLSYDSSSTIANARVNIWPFTSIVVAIKSFPMYFPHKNVPLIFVIGLQCLNPSTLGLNVQKTRMKCMFPEIPPKGYCLPNNVCSRIS